MGKNLTILMLGLLTVVQVFGQRNCGTMGHLEDLQTQFPRSTQQMARIEQFTKNYVNNPLKANEQTITIPVVVHVVYGTSSENISNTQVQSQIDVLNEDFRRMNADKSNTPSYFAGVATDVNIEFCLASTDPNGNATSGITRTSTNTSVFSDNDAVKYSSSGGKNAWATDKYLNLWVCDLGSSLLGYAQFPGSGSAATDGVVINYRYFGRGGSAQSPFNKGRTATHEVGHWLNLRHIWGDGGCSYDDYVNDTPIAGSAHYGCPSWPTSTCSSYDMYMNYMDYVDDGCMNMFSVGQKNRMRALFASGGYRESLLSSNGCGGGTTPPPSGYCSTNGKDASYEWIAGVQIGSLNHTSGTDGGYKDNTSISVDMTQGSTYSVNLTPGFGSSTYNEYWKIWIDYNQDNDFDDAGELAFDAGSMSSSAVSGNITIPTSASTGSTRMRVSMKYNGAQTACESFDYGEVEDYTVNIEAEAEVCNTPTGLSTTNITTTSAQANWSNVTNAVNYTLQYKKSTTSTWSSASSTTLTGLTPSTTYNWRVKTNCSTTSSSYSSTQTFTTDDEPVSTGYCDSKGSNSSYEWIANVQVGGINKSTGSNGGYADFTSTKTDLEIGTATAVSLSPGFGSSSYNEYWKIWIDYNQDGDFSDAGELAFDAGSMSSSTVTGSITVPSGVLTGETRMRVSMKYNGAQTACETFSYGEVEDYTVNIKTANTPPPPPPEYCGSKGSNSSYEWISRVKVNTIDNSTGNDGGYEDYTSQSTSLNAGSSYGITLTPGFSGSAYNEYWKIWIDFNKDGDFTDAGELVYDQGGMSQSTVNGTLSIPSNAEGGSTRMRVSMKYNGAPSSCETFSYGEVEDYTVNISSSSRLAQNASEVVSSEITMVVFPNPAVDRVTVNLNGFSSSAHIMMMDLQGRVLINEMKAISEEGTLSNSFSVSEYEEGTYFIIAREGSTVKKQKVVIMK